MSVPKSTPNWKTFVRVGLEGTTRSQETCSLPSAIHILKWFPSSLKFKCGPQARGMGPSGLRGKSWNQRVHYLGKSDREPP